MANEHLKRAKAANGDDEAAVVNIQAAWIRMQEAIKKALEKIQSPLKKNEQRKCSIVKWSLNNYE